MTRLYTEDKNRQNVLNILDGYCEGYTIIPAIGAWKGKQESSLIIELFDVNADTVQRIAEDIATANDQEYVAVENVTSEVTFVSGKLATV